MKDSVVVGGKVAYKVVGGGDMPLEDIVETLRGGGYQGFYSLEWTKRWNWDLEEPGIAFASYVDYMRSL